METISFLTYVKEDEIRRHAMCSVCLQVKDRIKVVKSATVHNSSLNSNVVPHTGSLQMLSISLGSKDGYVKTKVLCQVISANIEGIFRKIHMYTPISFVEIMTITVYFLHTLFLKIPHTSGQ